MKTTLRSGFFYIYAKYYNVILGFLMQVDAS